MFTVDQAPGCVSGRCRAGSGAGWPSELGHRRLLSCVGSRAADGPGDLWVTRVGRPHAPRAAGARRSPRTPPAPADKTPLYDTTTRGLWAVYGTRIAARSKVGPLSLSLVRAHTHTRGPAARSGRIRKAERVTRTDTHTHTNTAVKTPPQKRQVKLDG